MIGPEHRAIPELLPQGRNIPVKVRFRHLRQYFFSEVARNFPHFHRDCRIFVGQIRMAGPAVDDAQGIAGGGKIEVQGRDHRMIYIAKINLHQIAHGGRHLIHQAAGLAEKYVFRVLGNLCDYLRGYRTITEHSIQHRTQQHLKGRRRAQARSRQHLRGYINVQAPDGMAHLGKLCRHAANQGCGGVLLVFLGLQLRKRHLIQGIALGLHPDHVRSVLRHCCQRIEIHRRSQHAAPLMVGMVAADFRPSRCRKIPRRIMRKRRPKALLHGLQPRRIHFFYLGLHGSHSSIASLIYLIQYTVLRKKGSGKIPEVAFLPNPRKFRILIVILKLHCAF